MNSDAVYLEVGKAIGLIQIADSAFAHMILFAFPDSELRTLSDLEKDGSTLRKATLGQLIKSLRTRVVLKTEFEALLVGYLKDRNDLVHHWELIEGWKDESRAIAFTIKVQKTAAYLFYVFSGVIRDWADQTGINVDDKFPDLREYFSLVDTRWKPLLAEFFDEVKPARNVA